MDDDFWFGGHGRNVSSHRLKGFVGGVLLAAHKATADVMIERDCFYVLGGKEADSFSNCSGEGPTCGARS